MLNGLCKFTKIDTAKSYGLLKREFWLAGFTYFLFVFSLFSITGVEFAVIALYLLAAYHPSRQNTQTGKLTPEMLDAVFNLARSLLLED